MHRELLLLGLLRQNDTHGYRLHEFINRDMAYCTDLTKPTAYRLLQKMAESGWIEETVEQDGNRPPRRVYRITALGEDNYASMLRENLAQHHPARFADDIGIAFVDTLPAADARQLLNKRRQAMTQELEALRRARNTMSHTQGGLSWVIEHQERHISAELAWLEEVLIRLGEKSSVP
jgi:DNA-binding PadR family transcriptional regulator